jgi:hypothetical protein
VRDEEEREKHIRSELVYFAFAELELAEQFRVGGGERGLLGRVTAPHLVHQIDARVYKELVPRYPQRLILFKSTDHRLGSVFARNALRVRYSLQKAGKEVLHLCGKLEVRWEAERLGQDSIQQLQYEEVSGETSPGHCEREGVEAHLSRIGGGEGEVVGQHLVHQYSHAPQIRLRRVRLYTPDDGKGE